MSGCPQRIAEQWLEHAVLQRPARTGFPTVLQDFFEILGLRHEHRLWRPQRGGDKFMVCSCLDKLEVVAKQRDNVLRIPKGRCGAMTVGGRAGTYCMAGTGALIKPNSQ
jgi:hypothetical protein